VDNIHSSFLAQPRRTSILYFNKNHFEDAIREEGWIAKRFESVFYPNYSCGISETIP